MEAIPCHTHLVSDYVQWGVLVQGNGFDGEVWHS